MTADVFGATYKTRIAGLLSASGTLSQIDVTDTVYITALAAGNPIVIEDVAVSGGEPNRVLALLESIEETATPAELQSMTIGWTSKDEYLRLGA